MGLSQFLQFSPTFTLTDMLSDILKDFLDACYLDLDKSGLIKCTMTGKNCAIASLHRDSFLAKVPGHWPDTASANTH
jgi:hypothetical protein